MSTKPTAYVVMCWDAGQNIDLAPRDRAYEAAWWPVAVVGTAEEAKQHCEVIGRLTRARMEYREVRLSPALPRWASALGPNDHLWWSWVELLGSIYPVPMDGEYLPDDDEFDPYSLLEKRAPGVHADKEKVYAIAPDAETAGETMTAMLALVAKKVTP